MYNCTSHYQTNVRVKVVVTITKLYHKQYWSAIYNNSLVQLKTSTTFSAALYATMSVENLRKTTLSAGSAWGPSVAYNLLVDPIFSVVSKVENKILLKQTNKGKRSSARFRRFKSEKQNKTNKLQTSPRPSSVILLRPCDFIGLKK